MIVTRAGLTFSLLRLNLLVRWLDYV